MDDLRGYWRWLRSKQEVWLFTGGVAHTSSQHIHDKVVWLQLKTLPNEPV